MTNGWVDLQVNGYAGVDFNGDDLTDERLHAACLALRGDGVAAILATIITEDVSIMGARLRRLVELRSRDPLARDIIAGIHIEGPFINETAGYRGAHPVDAIRPANVESMRDLLEAAGGLTRLVTLAPERDENSAVIRLLAREGVRVSAGHSDASLDELSAAIDAGLSMFTHLGNGCPMQMHRHDNIVQRALSFRDRLIFCFIADGVHVPLFALDNYLRCAGIERCLIVTDAIAAAGLGPGRYRLSRWEVVVGPDLAARAPDGSHLVGSAMTMPQNAENLRQKLRRPENEIRQLLIDRPAEIIGLV